MIKILLASLKTSWRWWLAIAAVVAVAVLVVLLFISQGALNTANSDKRVLESDNQLQGQVIANQAFNFNRFNQVAAYTANLNSLIGANSDATVIEYREILRNDKTCDLPVPADVAGGLYNYASRLRASAMHTDTGNADTTRVSSTSASTLTYCQAVLWIDPLLTAIEKANNQLAGIRELERVRNSGD